jgi:TPP-dependent pyruvate/acetoin dehydrogenase alpha subunit
VFAPRIPHADHLARHRLDNICERARSYGMPAQRIPDNDTLAIYHAVRATAEVIRRDGAGPSFFECMTYRWKEHVGPGEDFALGYRTREEAAPWMARDQVRLFGDRLEPALRRQIEGDIEAEIAQAIAFAEASPFPDLEELYTEVLAP